MSEVKPSPIWYPPQFPLQGRLPIGECHVQKNLLLQSREAQNYHDGLCVAAGYRVTPPCCKSLHISLFFDGTGNNLNHDVFESNPPHPTNIARMFRASIGDGYAGGASHNRWLTDGENTGYNEFFKYYIPGVGTPFPEIEDLDFDLFGMAFGAFGEARINWGLLMIIDALYRGMGLSPPDNVALLAAVRAMSSQHGAVRLMGKRARASEFRKQLKALARPLRIAVEQPTPGQCKLLGIKLFVYGFSRGAASARAFVTWLNELLQSAPYLALDDLKLPISIEYLGILDTVASVGLADIAPGVSGHSAWADETQPLPHSGLVKRCLHLVAGHEQRLCFPVDSIRREDGSYPDNCEEVIYPGVHSDVGGGYPPGDQGKAFGRDDRLLLSQIALNDLYSDAFSYGAPLKVLKETLPKYLSDERWRALEIGVAREFSVDSTLVNRFNAWRQITLGLPPSPHPLPLKLTQHYTPILASIPLEKAMSAQMTWLTAWRIGRYASGNLKTTPFYLRATDTHAQRSVRIAAEAARDRKQTDIKKLRREQQTRERAFRTPPQLLPPGAKDFDADMAQTQLREAAEEFRQAYEAVDPLSTALQRKITPPFTDWVLLFMLINDARAQALRMRQEGLAHVDLLFPAPSYSRPFSVHQLPMGPDEQRNADEPSGWLRALFDDQVHDSRAWFLYQWGRELRGSYFRERMVFFGEARRKAFAKLIEHEAELIAVAEQSEPWVMDPQRLAEARKAIEKTWSEYYAQRAEINDV